MILEWLALWSGILLTCWACMYRVGGDAGAGWRHEAEVMAKVCDHRNIVQLHEVYEDASYVYILMEPCLGARAVLMVCPTCDAQHCLQSEGTYPVTALTWR